MDIDSIQNARISNLQDQINTLSGEIISSPGIIVGPVGNAPNANAATIVPGAPSMPDTLMLEPCNELYPGVITTVAQPIAGHKTFKGQITSEDQINIGVAAASGYIRADGPSIEVQSNGDLYFAVGDTTLNEIQMSGKILMTADNTTIDYGNVKMGKVTPVSPFAITYYTSTNEITFPDVTGDVVLTAGNQTIADLKTFTSTITGNANLSLTDNTSEIIINGERALHTFGPNNVFVGNSGNQTMTQGVNNFVGNLCGNNCTSANNNTFMGHASANSLTTGTFNVGMGRSAAFSLTTGNNNVAIGNSAMSGNTTGLGNVAVGSSALGGSIPTQAVAIGLGALQSEAGSNADFSVAVGYEAVKNNPTFQRGVAIGWNAGNVASHGNDNILVGFNAGSAGGGSNNIMLGSQGAVGDNQIMIGKPTHTSCTIEGIIGAATSAGDSILSITPAGKITSSQVYSPPSQVMSIVGGTITSSFLRGTVQAVPGTMTGIRFSRSGSLAICAIPAFMVSTSINVDKIQVLAPGSIPAAFLPQFPTECSGNVYIATTNFSEVGLFRIGTDGSLSYNTSTAHQLNFGPTQGDSILAYIL